MFLQLFQVLNVGWSYFILKVAYQAMFVSGSIANDARSDGSSSDDNNGDADVVVEGVDDDAKTSKKTQ